MCVQCSFVSRWTSSSKSSSQLAKSWKSFRRRGCGSDVTRRPRRFSERIAATRGQPLEHTLAPKKPLSHFGRNSRMEAKLLHPLNHPLSLGMLDHFEHTPDRFAPFYFSLSSKEQKNHCACQFQVSHFDTNLLLEVFF